MKLLKICLIAIFLSISYLAYAEPMTVQYVDESRMTTMSLVFFIIPILALIIGYAVVPISSKRNHKKYRRIIRKTDHRD